jgi:subtilisin family serine protease
MLRTKNRSTRLGRLFHLLLVISAMSIGLLAQTPEDQLTVVSVSPDAGADHGHHPSRVIVRFRSDPSFLPDSKSNHGLGADNVYVVENPPGLSVAEAVRHYREDPNVLYVEPDYEVNTTADPTDPLWSQQWDMVKIAAPGAWDLQTSASDVIVAVIDTGVDLTHPDLQANLWTNPKDGSHGFTCMNGTCARGGQDDYGHGTHVAGTIGAVGNNGIGIAGINWRTQILSCKFLDSNGGGNVSDAVLCFNQVLALKQQGFNIRVTNNSWGGAGFSQALKDAMTAVETAGVVNVCAAGNSGVNADLAPMYPGAFDNRGLVSVLASDQNDLGAYFTNYGVANVDIAAPGVSTVSTVPTGTCPLCDPSGYRPLSGTSMATPHVAGALAAIFHANPKLSAFEARDAILDRASYDSVTDPLGSMTSTGGRLNLQKALTNPILSSPKLNNFPVLNQISNVSANAGDTVNLTAIASDPDNDPLRMIWSKPASGVDTLWLFGWMLTQTFPNPTGDSISFQSPALARSALAPYAISVTDGRGGSATSVAYATVLPSANPGQPPTGNLTLSPNSGPIGTVVSVNFPAVDPEGGLVAWDIWETGQSFASGICCHTGPSYNLTFNAAGAFRVSTQAIDKELNFSNRQSAVVRIGGATGTPPIANAVFDKLTGAAPLTVNIDMSASNDPDGTIKQYIILCQNGISSAFQVGKMSSCTYNTPGTYWIWLEVLDNDNLVDVLSAYAVVTPLSSPISSKTPASVVLSSMTMNYTGGTLVPSATTNPPGLGITWTNAPQSQAGSYAVTATVNDPNYAGSASGTFTITKTAASVVLSNMTQTYTGCALTPTATTNPPGHSIVWTNAPQSQPGSYTVTATVSDPDYQGSASGTFTISSVGQPPPPPPPSTQPSVTITNPHAGVVQIGTVTIQAAVTQGTNPIARVDFLVNGSVKCSDTSAPYTCSWKMPGATGKIYWLQANAYDTSGRVGMSSIVQVTSSH